MTTLTGLDVEFRPLHVPASIDDADAAEFIAFTHMRNSIYREIAGDSDDDMTPEALLPHYQPSPDEIRRSWIIVDQGTLVGRIGVDIPLEAGSQTAFWLVELLRSHQGRGIGTAAYRVVEQTAREHGRTVLQSWAEHPDAPGPRLTPPTGFGSIPEDRVARFYLRNGYTLEQIERNSDLDVGSAAARIPQLLAEAQEKSAGYRIVQWQPPTPPEFIEGYAWMKSRMSTDAPAAALEFDEERWDAERLARHDQRYLDGGRTVLITAAQHVASGQLVAFNELSTGPGGTDITTQEDTLVLVEHRGHRLGMLVKCAALQRWHAEIAPHSPKVITTNAEENRPMLDINEAIGFVPSSYVGGWKKVLAD